MKSTSKKTLTKWKKEALKSNDTLEDISRSKNTIAVDIKKLIDHNDRILTLTQELLDLQLLKEIK